MAILLPGEEERAGDATAADSYHDIEGKVVSPPLEEWYYELKYRAAKGLGTPLRLGLESSAVLSEVRAYPGGASGGLPAGNPGEGAPTADWTGGEVPVLEGPLLEWLRDFNERSGMRFGSPARLALEAAAIVREIRGRAGGARPAAAPRDPPAAR